METAHYQRALEGELARSVMAIGAVRNTRVHLALPRDSVFVRRRQAPSASVIVELHKGRVLSEGQVRAIVHLVSSSVPRLAEDHVSIVDQDGNLLTAVDGRNALGLSTEQLRYTKALEDHYIKRIEDIVTPIVGLGRVRAQVAVDLDFTVTEETAELYDPKNADGMLRSEQLVEDVSSRARPVGVPGALSNQPPGAGAAPESVAGEKGDVRERNEPLQSRSEHVRNFELDKRVKHVRTVPGTVKRVSVAVVLDDRVTENAAGEVVRTPLKEVEMERISSLVKDAIGFNSARGDTAEIINVSFAEAPFEGNELPIWKEPWFTEVVRVAVVAVVALLVFVLVVRPLLLRFGTKGDGLGAANAAVLEERSRQGVAVLSGDAPRELEEDRVSLDHEGGAGELENPLVLLESRLNTAKALVMEDPRRSVQVIRNWLDEERASSG